VPCFFSSPLRPPRRDPGAVGDAIAGVEHDGFPLLDTLEDAGLESVPASCYHGAEPGSAVLDDVEGPLVGGGVAEEGAGGDEEDVLLAADHDGRLDAVAVAEEGVPSGVFGIRVGLPLGSEGREIGVDPDALLVDAEGGNLGEGGGLDAPDVGLEGLLAAPVLEADEMAGPDADGVSGEHIDADLKVLGVADLKDALSGADDGAGLLEAAQDDAVDGRFDLEGAAGLRAVGVAGTGFGAVGLVGECPN